MTEFFLGKTIKFFRILTLNILNPKSSSSERRGRRRNIHGYKVPSEYTVKMTAVLCAPLRWRQGALISKTPCSECMIRSIHKINSTNNIIFIFFPWYPLGWANCNNISKEKWKTEIGFFINWETHLLLPAFEFSKCLVNFYASVMTTSKYTRIFCPLLFMYS